jgi:ATP-dependent DNA ligase
VANETVMLAKEYDPKKAKFPVQVTEKLDGAACKIGWEKSRCRAFSRQFGKHFTSVGHITDELGPVLPPGMNVVGELTVDGVPNFKDAGGIIRRLTRDERIKLNIYDYFSDTRPDLSYAERMKMLAVDIPDIKGMQHVRLIPGKTAFNEEEVEDAVRQIFDRNPLAEGAMIRGWGDVGYEPGKRSWNMMRHKPKPTIDLPVHSFEEAVSKEGEPLGMVGRINVLFKGEVVGVGPGKFTHDERKAMWRTRKKYAGKILEVQYMRDPGYSALRQPTAQRWRPDKDA